MEVLFGKIERGRFGGSPIYGYLPSMNQETRKRLAIQDVDSLGFLGVVRIEVRTSLTHLGGSGKLGIFSRHPSDRSLTRSIFPTPPKRPTAYRLGHVASSSLRPESLAHPRCDHSRHPLFGLPPDVEDLRRSRRAGGLFRVYLSLSLSSSGMSWDFWSRKGMYGGHWKLQ